MIEEQEIPALIHRLQLLVDGKSEDLKAADEAIEMIKYLSSELGSSRFVIQRWQQWAKQ